MFVHYRLIRKLPEPVIQTYVKRSPKAFSQNNNINNKTIQYELNDINCKQKQTSHIDMNEITNEQKKREDHGVLNEIFT